MPCFCVLAFGCKVNQVEAQGLREGLHALGFTAADEAEADLIVLHTCAVTAEAMRKIRQRLRSLRRDKPHALLAVTGCYVLAEAQSLADSGQVDLAEKRWTMLLKRLGAGTVSGSAGMKERIRTGRANKQRQARKTITIIDQSTARGSPDEGIRIDPPSTVKPDFSTTRQAIHAVAAHHDRHRAFVKVQDGCDSFCAYCIVPHLRSELRSKAADQTAQEVRGLLAAGYREIVLVGIHLGAWGRPTTRPPRRCRLPELLAPLLEIDAPGAADWRIRLSSIEAQEVTDELLALMAHPRLCPHLHVPLQSGSDAVLARMNRPTATADFRDAVARARRALDAPALTTDLIAGLPGESDADFQATVDLCREVGFARCHVFPFSPREGTPAAAMPEQVPVALRRRRARRLRELSEQMAAAFAGDLLGRRERLLIERIDAKRQTASGHADRYLKIEIPLPATPPPLGTLVNVQIDAPAHAAPV